MSADFVALAAAVVAGLPEVSACLLLSRDGLSLACQPQAAEPRAVEQWRRVASLGQVERGFVALEGTLLAFVLGPRYAGLAVAASGGRPGPILVELEQALQRAEQGEVRTGRDGPSANRGGTGPDRPRRRPVGLHRGRERQPARRKSSPRPEAARAQPSLIDPHEVVREFGGLLSRTAPDEEAE